MPATFTFLVFVFSMQSEEALQKQVMLVQYLKDSVKFSKIIHKSLPIVAQLLGSKQNTDILEAIEFFVSAFEFGVLNAMLGVRRMLSLIWSRETTIKVLIRSMIPLECLCMHVTVWIPRTPWWLPTSGSTST